jgi:lysophospholipase L1-like esterase
MINAEIFLKVLYPAYCFANPSLIANAKHFLDWVRNYCSSQGVVLMEYYKQIADAQGQLPTACHDGDGLHPNSAGYDILSPMVIPTLESAL